ncbi:hypothetical protein AX16_002685 [Volvariella volvacea WC 439]|nr:hypothetical protein AX16_002685 [Volvariella volvacea WC 439]
MASLVIVSIALAPLVNVVVRYRASKSKESIFNIAKALWLAEGVEGVMRGASIPTIMSLIYPFYMKVYISPSPTTLNVSAAYSLLINTFYLPLLILTYRSIMTTQPLNVWKPRDNTPILFTNKERKRPYLIYLTPGLAPAFTLSIIIQIMILRPVRNWVQQSLVSSEQPSSFEEYAIYTAVYAAVAIVATVLLTPLDVAITRLVLQENYTEPSLGSWFKWRRNNPPEETKEGDANSTPRPTPEVDLESGVVDKSISTPSCEKPEQPADLEGLSDTVKRSPISNIESLEQGESLDEVDVTSRPSDHYTGLANCLWTIAKEEGVLTLYRGWWLTMAGQICTA